MPEDYAKRFAEIKGLKLLMGMKLAGVPFPPVLLADDTSASAEHFKYILASYGRQAKAHAFAIDKEADLSAAELNQESLQSALEQMVSMFSPVLYPALLPPYCRYASGKQIKELHTKIGKWSRGNAQERKTALAAWNALLLSDTREAMLYAEKQGLLWKYAEMRGTDADTLRDTVLSELGFDENGCKTYDLGSGTVTATLNDDLTLALQDDKSGKLIKSVSKRNADPEKYEAAKADLAELRKNVKRVAKNRSDRLFEAFLNGREFIAGDWKAIYLTNPILNRVARLLVWTQGETCFALSAPGPVCSDEKPYDIEDKPIRVAHPAEMTAEETAAWQYYYLARGLKQPFQQVWEPVRNADEVLPNRYAGITIPLNFFKGAEKHGLRYSYLGAVDLSFSDCLVRYNVGERRHELDPDATIEIIDFRFPKYTRQVNHIVTILDRWTVRGRIMKDDLSVMDLLPGFTLAQITEFIAAAQEANAVNVLAALLEYKNANFADFDPMEEFTLEW